MHLPRCVTDERRTCRLGKAGACANCPHNTPGKRPPPEVITAKELRDFAAACRRMANDTPHRDYVERGYPMCKWCGDAGFHRCPQAVFRGAAARLKVDR